MPRETGVIFTDDVCIEMKSHNIADTRESLSAYRDRDFTIVSDSVVCDFAETCMAIN